MEIKKLNTQGRVRRSSTSEQNREIDSEILKGINRFRNASDMKISQRLEELSKEWDIERTLQVNASSVSLVGLALGTFVHKNWYLLPAVVGGFLLQHGLQGWCPPLPIFRAFGFRTKKEIEEERYALKILRGDFKNLSGTTDPQEILNTIRTQ